MPGRLIKHDTHRLQVYWDNTVPGSFNVDCDGYASGILQVDCTGCLIEMQGSVNGIKWDPLCVISLYPWNHTWSQINAPGLWAFGCANLVQIRGWVVGNLGALNIYAGLTTAAFAWPYCCDEDPTKQAGDEDVPSYERPK